MYPENLLAISQNFQSAEIVSRFSQAVGESLEKTRQGLKTVVPTLLYGLISRTESEPGPDHLIHLVNKDGIEMKQISNLDNEHIISIGSDALSGIFGKDLDTVAYTLGQSLEIESSNVKKLMGLAAPFVMGMIGHKMRREGLSPSGLVGFLSQQKNTLDFNPADSHSTYIDTTYGPADPASESPWFALFLVALLLATLIWWSRANT